MPAVQHHQQRLPTVDEAGDSEYYEGEVHYIAQEKSLYIISEHDFVRSLSQVTCERDLLPHRIIPLQRRPPQPLMATLTYSHNAQSQSVFGAPPGSPPDLTNSKSSKSSSIHSSSLLDFMGTTENLSHFEDINLDETTGGPSSLQQGHHFEGLGLRTGKLKEDRTGHKDQVFALDWSPDGGRVGSGGADKQVRIWSN
jgi:WD40 repeat protein